MGHVSVLIGCWLLFSFTLILSMDNVNLALAELLLIAQSLSTASDALYSQNHHRYYFHQVPEFIVVMWKTEIAVALFLLLNFTITPPLFFFSSSLGSFIKSLGK